MKRALPAFLLAAAASLAQGVEGPVVLIIGAPGAGKTTQAEALSAAYRLPAITSEQIISENAATFAKLRQTAITGMEPQTDPVLNKLFVARIEKQDVAKGFIVAGYPATKDHADFLAKLVADKRLPSPMVVQLDVPDDEVRKRLAKHPKYGNLEQLIKDYHREMDMLKLYFPAAEIHTIDGRPKVETVTKKIRAVLDPKIKSPK